MPSLSDDDTVRAAINAIDVEESGAIARIKERAAQARREVEASREVRATVGDSVLRALSEPNCLVLHQDVTLVPAGLDTPVAISNVVIHSQDANNYSACRIGLSGSHSIGQSAPMVEDPDPRAPAKRLPPGRYRAIFIMRPLKEE